MTNGRFYTLTQEAPLWARLAQGPAHLGDGAFCEVLVGEVSGLPQLAGDREVCRVRGLPTEVWEGQKKHHQPHTAAGEPAMGCAGQDTYLWRAATVTEVTLQQLGGSVLKRLW